MDNKPFKCPDMDVFDWYLTKFRLIIIQNRQKEKCEKLVNILNGALKDLIQLQKIRPMLVDPCADEEFEPCEDECVPIGTCEILTGGGPAAEG